MIAALIIQGQRASKETANNKTLIKNREMLSTSYQPNSDDCNNK